MRIIVVGAGKVGFEIAQRLAGEQHDVTVIDRDPEALQQVAARLDVMTMTGNGASPRVLEECGVDRTDLMVAVTDRDEVNMIACMVAKQFGARTCVARIRNPEYSTNDSRPMSLTQLGIDRVIDPDRLAAVEIERLLKMPIASEVDTFAGGQITLIGCTIDDKAVIVGKSLAEIDLPNLLIVAIVRNGQVMIPKGRDVVKASDRLFIIGRTDDLKTLRQVLRRKAVRIRRIAIVGASRIGVQLAEALTAKRSAFSSVMLLEKSAARAADAAALLPHTVVLHGDGTKIDTLREEGIDTCDAVVAVSGEDHTNLLTTMLAKELGVNDVITEITREDYIPLAKRAGADAVVVPRLLVAGSVLRLLRASQMVSLTILYEGDAQVLEFEAVAGSPIVNKPLRQIPFPAGAIVGAVVQGEKATVARGNTVIRPGDRVIVFSVPSVATQVEALFQTKGHQRERTP